ncbi:MAG: bifunctional UDP-N-acetylglucosamine diphosphorylase/glucosamine-1-phosphate N-acetyltransferase GlmU [Myxococcota bacterium]|nr:bifunctional UDP-N-acetylglucosamine diphosphorylase/glucosamine-1-phosphate N-acetyltransferase GlmU [Myxococcota bacterium]
MNNLAAVVLCAGKGTRMKSERSKVLHPILGRPLCYYPITRALQSGASPVVAVVGHQADAVQQAISASFPDRDLRYAVQKEQRGTADAVKSAQGALAGFEGPVLIVYGDVPLLRTETLQALLAAYRAGKAPLALVTTHLEDPTGYGRIVRENGRVVRNVEQKDCTPEQKKIQEGNAGIYVVDARFLWASLEKVGSSNAQGEFYLTDLVEMAAAEGEIQTLSVDATETAGVNDRAELSLRAVQLRRRINLAHMRAGVSLADPETTYIEEDVVIGPDTEIAPGVSLHAGCRIAGNVRIGQGSVLSNTLISEGTNIKAYSVFEDAQVGKACEIGPFARLRPGTVLAEKVHLGNFVETKKTVIGRGSKANHLAYLGDAEIGAGVNVGAGTITCNYDGKNKFKTVLEDEVFIGSDTQLVAPVRVGRGAYVAAGTTVTQDVPSLSLALSRAPQTNKEGWVTKKRAREAEAAAKSSKDVAAKTG